MTVRIGSSGSCSGSFSWTIPGQLDRRLPPSALYRLRLVLRLCLWCPAATDPLQRCCTQVCPPHAHSHNAHRTCGRLACSSGGIYNDCSAEHVCVGGSPIALDILPEDGFIAMAALPRFLLRSVPWYPYMMDVVPPPIKLRSVPFRGTPPDGCGTPTHQSSVFPRWMWHSRSEHTRTMPIAQEKFGPLGMFC
jgi:hypothetical protein